LGFRRIIWFTRSREGANFEVIICDHCYGRNAEVGERGWEEGWCAVAGTFSRTASSSTFEMSRFDGERYEAIFEFEICNVEKVLLNIARCHGSVSGTCLSCFLFSRLCRQFLHILALETSLEEVSNFQTEVEYAEGE
jgi:hypothetical protein